LWLIVTFALLFIRILLPVASEIAIPTGDPVFVPSAITWQFSIWIVLVAIPKEPPVALTLPAPEICRLLDVRTPVPLDAVALNTALPSQSTTKVELLFRLRSPASNPVAVKLAKGPT